MGQLLDRLSRIPLATKAAVVLVFLGLLTVLNYFVIGIPLFGSSISEIENKILKVDADQRRFDGELIEKQAIANDLNRFRKEKELLEQRLKQALAELPDDKKLDELLQMFQEQAQKAGLEIISIVPDAPASAGFYIKIPIKMKVVGNFHEIATFFDALGRLRRIVNVGTITLDTPKDVNGKVTVGGSFVATTFMFAPAPSPSAAPAPGKKGKS